MIRPLALLAALPFAVLPAFAADDDHGDDDHLASAGGVEILHAWTNAGQGDTARVYMEIANTGEAPVTLTGGAAGIAGAVALMGAPVRAGSADLVPVPAVSVAPGAEMDLDPGGLFLYLTGLEAPLIEGEAFDMQLAFEPVGEVEIHVAIESADARRHSHAGHSH